MIPPQYFLPDSQASMQYSPCSDLSTKTPCSSSNSTPGQCSRQPNSKSGQVESELISALKQAHGRRQSMSYKKATAFENQVHPYKNLRTVSHRRCGFPRRSYARPHPGQNPTPLGQAIPPQTTSRKFFRSFSYSYNLGYVVCPSIHTK